MTTVCTTKDSQVEFKIWKKMIIAMPQESNVDMR